MTDRQPDNAGTVFSRKSACFLTEGEPGTIVEWLWTRCVSCACGKATRPDEPQFEQMRDEANMGMKDPPRDRPRLYLSSPTMHGDEQRFIQEAFDSNWIAPLGRNVDEFEREVAAYVGVPCAVALISGTAALHLAVKLAGAGPGDLVFCSDLTFAATVNPVSYEGGRQVFIDAERETWNMSPQALEAAFKKYDGSAPDRPRPKAVIAVSLYGTPAKFDELNAICDRHGVPLIEDAAESLSATYKGSQTGKLGRYGILSFNGNKIITTSGGGMLLTHDAASARKARFWATQARDPAPWYEHSELGYNYRMSNVLAGIGRGQLLHLEAHRARKQRIYQRYKQGLQGLPLVMNPCPDNTRPNHWLSCILLDADLSLTPEDLRLKLEEYNMEARPLWKPMHMQPFYQGHDFISQEGNVAADLFERGLCLPSDIKMTDAQQDEVISIIRGLLARG